MSNQNNILEFKNVTIGYPQKTLIENITTSTKKGSLVAIMGLNGTGKTTLFKTILKEIKPLSGEIILNENNIFSNSNFDISSSLSVVFTEKIQIFGFTVFDLISMGRMPHTNHFGGLKSKDIEIVNYYIKLLNLKELKNQQINNLSDGQFQKVMIAKALAQETPLLLLDEPTAFLDIKNKEIIFKLLKKLAVEMGKTIFVSTHNLDFCKEYCDDLWLIKDNKLKVYPGNEITKEFFN